MIAIPKPMLAGRPESDSEVRFPVLASPKLDGIRCLIVRGKVLSRKFVEIPNRYVREYLQKFAVEGMDGELMVRGDFSSVQSAIMSEEGEPDFQYHVFDLVVDSLSDPFHERFANLREAVQDLNDPQRRIRLVPHVEIRNLDALAGFEAQCLAEGFEGVMVRSPNGPYKAGRSTVREGALLKIKRFRDSEAEILSVVPQFHNENEAQKDAFGRTKRSTAQDGLVEKETLGAFHVRDLKTGAEFDIGTGRGLTVELRKSLWERRKAIVGKRITYRFQEVGTKDLPRFPIYLGFRDSRDMD